jgi:hypothetical protein
MRNKVHGEQTPKIMAASTFSWNKNNFTGADTTGSCIQTSPIFQSSLAQEVV